MYNDSNLLHYSFNKNILLIWNEKSRAYNFIIKYFVYGDLKNYTL